MCTEKRPSKECQELGLKLGSFYLHKNEVNYEKTAEEIRKLHITHLKMDCGKLHIYTARPGLLIGAKGKNIDALAKFFNCGIHIHETYSLNDYLIPEDLSHYFDGYMIGCDPEEQEFMKTNPYG
jgi:hypothetical protein